MDRERLVAARQQAKLQQQPGTNTLERKNKDLNKATRELEAKVRTLQQKTTAAATPTAARSLPRLTAAASSQSIRSQHASPSRSGGGGLTRALPTTPKEEREDGPGRKSGSTVTSRIREREAEFKQQVVERDTQIARLKERLKILSSKETVHTDQMEAFTASLLQLILWGQQNQTKKVQQPNSAGSIC